MPYQPTPVEVPPPARTILVVDDVADSRDVLARLLRLSGYKSIVAEDGEAALNAVESEAPDLVLLDLMMPGMDGVEVLRHLREDPRFHDLPVILFTALSDGKLLTDAAKLGVQDYI